MNTTFEAYGLFDVLMMPCMSHISRHFLTSHWSCCGMVLWGRYTVLSVVVRIEWANLSQNPWSLLWSENTFWWSYSRFRSQSYCSLLNGECSRLNWNGSCATLSLNYSFQWYLDEVQRIVQKGWTPPQRVFLLFQPPHGRSGGFLLPLRGLGWNPTLMVFHSLCNTVQYCQGCSSISYILAANKGWQI